MAFWKICILVVTGSFGATFGLATAAFWCDSRKLKQRQQNIFYRTL